MAKTSTNVIPANARAKTTKGAVKTLRKEGFVPAVVYGDKKEPILAAIENKVLLSYLEQPGFLTCVVELDIDGKKHRVLPRDVQFHPLTDCPLHVDFLRVSAETRVRVAVPVAFVDAEKSPGIKRGGTLNVVHHTIEISCAPDNIPANFTVSLDGLQINDAIHLSSLVMPKGASVTTHEKDFTIATIAVPSAIRSEVAASATSTAEDEAKTAETAAAAPAADAKAADAKK